MNGEILFRGKRDDNGEWVYGYFVADALEQIGRDCPMGWIRHYNNNNEKVEVYQIERKTLGQYIGIKDKNGTKIFEGDIVGYDNAGYYSRAKIEYQKCQFVCKHLYNSLITNPTYMNVEFEVIGNIFDNPKLLEVEKTTYIIKGARL